MSDRETEPPPAWATPSPLMSAIARPRRDCGLYLRCSIRERTRWRAAADESAETLSAWVRRVLDEASR